MRTWRCKNSHDHDKSKTLTYAEINSVVEAVKTAPTMPGSDIRRTLLDHNSPTKNIPVKLKHASNAAFTPPARI